MIIEFGKKQSQKIIVLNNSLESLLKTFRSQCCKVYASILNLHKKFYLTIEKYKNDKQQLLKKILSISNSYQLLLLQICATCQTMNINQLGKLLIKIHLQNMQIIKWFIKNMSNKSILNQSQYRNIYQQIGKNKKNLQHDNTGYYRLKENTMFMVKGIGNQVTKMSEQFFHQQLVREEEIRGVLNANKIASRIQSNQSQQLLIQAVEAICHNSQIFRKLAKQNQQKLIENTQRYTPKPFLEIKNQFDEVIKQKMQKAAQKMWETLNRYRDKRDKKIEQQKITKQYSQSGTQVNLYKEDQQKTQNELKQATKNYKQTLINLNYEKNRADKLQQLLRSKCSQQQKLLKSRHEKDKKSINCIQKVQQTSMIKIDDIISIQEKSFFNKSKKQVDFNITTDLNFAQNKSKRTLKKHNTVNHQKSLSKLHFHSSIQPSRQFINISPYLTISQQEVNQQFNFTNIMQNQVMEILRKEKENKISMLAISLNIINIQICQFGLENQKRQKRNKPLIAITNMKNSKNNKTGQFSKIQNKKFITRKVSRNQSSDQLTHLNQFFYSTQTNQKMIQIIKKPYHIHGPSLDLFDRNSQEQHTSRDKINEQLFRNSQNKQKTKFIGNFQILNFKQDSQIKNKKRMNQMLIQLNKKRLYKQDMLKNSQNKRKSSKLKEQIFQSSILLNLYFNQENAMQAQIQYGVSVQNQIIDTQQVQKSITQPKVMQNIKNENYILQFSKKIQNSLLQLRHKQPKLYKQTHQIIKFPSSYLKGIQIIKQNIKQYLSFNQIKNFVRFITNLHQSCIDKPCQHFNLFLNKINVKKY